MCEANEKHKLDAKDWIIIALGIIILLLGIGCGIYYHKYQKAEGQVVIWNDSTYFYKNKYNEEYAAKNTYILKAEQLQAYNNELYKEYKSLKDNPIVITKTKVVTKLDTVYTDTHDVTHDGDMIAWTWDAKDSTYYKMSGQSIAYLNNIDSTETIIDNLEMNANLTLDVIDNGEQLSVIAKTDNPYMQLGDMQSVIIDPMNSPTFKNYYKPKRWGLSLYLGGGLNIGYDLINKGVGINAGGSIGIAITYDLIQW